MKERAFHPIITAMRRVAIVLFCLSAAVTPVDVVAAQELTEARRVQVAQRLQRSSVDIEAGPSQGSGFLVGEERWVITNAHVVRPARGTPVRVRVGPSEVVRGRVIALEPDHDLAVIQLERRPQSPSLPLGDSERVAVGQAVLAFGSPFGLGGTLTQGIVSARRDFPIGGTPVRGAIQTDAPINPGNSGGPLVNSRGEVIGVNTAIFSRTGGSHGIGFAVPSNYVRDLLVRLRRTNTQQGRANTQQGRASAEPQVQERVQTRQVPVVQNSIWLGIYGDDFQESPYQGVRIRRVVPGGPADRAGLRGSDDRTPRVVAQHGVPWTGHIILAVDGHRIRTMRELHAHLGRRRAGETATLFVTVGPGALTGELSVQLSRPPPRSGAGSRQHHSHP